MVRDYCPAELRNIVLKIYKVLALLVRDDIVEVDVLIPPLEVMDDSLVSQFLLHDEQVLEEVNDALVDVEMIEFRNHGFLVFEVLLIGVDEGVPLVNDGSDVIEDLLVHVALQTCQCLVQSSIFALFAFELLEHILNCFIVAVQLSNYHFIIHTVLEA